MLVYKKVARGEKRAAWRNNHFLRFSGIADRILHKTALRFNGDGDLLHSGRIERIRREFTAFEAAKTRELLSQICTIQAALMRDLQAYQALNAMPLSHVAEELRTSWDLKNANKQLEANAKRSEQRTALTASLTKSVCLLDQTVARFDSEIIEALAEANAGIARYSKAAFFKVVDREIPVLTTQTHGITLTNQALIRKAKEVLQNV